MYVTPPMQNTLRPVAERPWWLLIGPGLAAVTGLFLLTVIYRYDGRSLLQIDLHLSSQSLLLSGLVAYVVAAVIALPAGLLLGGRFPTAVTVPATCLMLLGVLLVGFTPSVGLLLVGRALNGLGAGAAIGAAAALIRWLRTGRAAAAGVTAGLGVLALALAPVIGASLSNVLNFRVTYLIGGLFVFAALIASAVGGIVTLTKAKPPVPPMPYGMPHPQQGPQYPQQGPQYPQQGPQYPPQNPPYA